MGIKAATGARHWSKVGHEFTPGHAPLRRWKGARRWSQRGCCVRPRGLKCGNAPARVILSFSLRSLPSSLSLSPSASVGDAASRETPTRSPAARAAPPASTSLSPFISLFFSPALLLGPTDTAFWFRTVGFVSAHLGRLRPVAPVSVLWTTATTSTTKTQLTICCC
jgi:hypothetical protein